jgi:4-oxalocrotonate tautomerase
LPRAFPRELRALISRLTEAVVETKVGPKQSVRMIVREVPPTHWAAPDETPTEQPQERRQQNT